MTPQQEIDAIYAAIIADIEAARLQAARVSIFIMALAITLAVILI